jgi:ATP-dependent DNA helicase RecG
MLGQRDHAARSTGQVLGKKASDTFEKVFGLRTVGDLLRHYPRRYYTGAS